MYVNSVSNQLINRINLENIQPHQQTTVNNNHSAYSTSDLQFCGLFPDLFIKKFSTPEESAMYKELSDVLDGKDKTNFNILYKTGRLSDRNSNDKSSTLENLYKIYKNPRAKGLDNKKILSETIERLANPFVINQKFGHIPENIANKILQEKTIAKNSLQAHPCDPQSTNDMNVKNSASCVAASIEFSLADKKPAEFARMVEGLSSPEISVKQNVKLKSLNKYALDALYLLKMFNVIPEKADWESVTVKIAPDRDAIIRARVQNTYADSKSRSSVDVLLQSAFMQLGSQSTYNSLTDKRYGTLNANDTGLTEFEKTFVESIVGNDGEKTSMVYQNVNDDAILEGYFHSFQEIQEHLLKTLAKKQNVIIGITETDANKKIVGGHEITVIGSKMKGDELYFICNDTDDNYNGPIEISAQKLIPKIHHAGIPVDILSNLVEENRGLDLLKQYSETQLKSKSAA